LHFFGPEGNYPHRARIANRVCRSKFCNKNSQKEYDVMHVIKSLVSRIWPARQAWGCFIVLLMAACAPMDFALAKDCVVPSSDVTNAVTLRAAPNTTSAMIGTLSAGASRPLVASVPRWYETRQQDGTPAFVAKRWTVIAPCPAGTTPAADTTPTTISAGVAAGAGFELHAIDVGTGLSVLVRGADFALLYDAGSNDDMARGDKNRTMAYLKTLQPQIQKIDNVILSHPHRDHVELLPDVVTHFQPRDVWNSGAYNDICGYRNFLLAIAVETSVQYHTATHDEGDEAVEMDAKNCYGEDQPEQTITLKHGAHRSRDFTTRAKCVNDLPLRRRLATLEFQRK
jgi:hypothetical protein